MDCVIVKYPRLGALVGGEGLAAIFFWMFFQGTPRLGMGPMMP